MSRAAWLNALLALAVAGLALFVYLRPDADTRDHAIGTPVRDARTISIERPDAPPIVLDKRTGGWFMSAPIAARADAARIEALLAIAAARSANRLATNDLARFELDRPAARLTIDGQSFAFGLVNPVSREQYVLAGGAVYTVSPRLGATLPALPSDLIDKRLFAGTESPARIELKDFTVAREDGRWALRPQAGESSQDDLQRWIDDWRHAAALRVEPYARGKPLAEVRVVLADGSVIMLAVLARATEVALLRADEKLVYYLFKASGERLLAPPTGREERAEKR